MLSGSLGLQTIETMIDPKMHHQGPSRMKSIEDHPSNLGHIQALSALQEAIELAEVVPIDELVRRRAAVAARRLRSVPTVTPNG